MRKIQKICFTRQNPKTITYISTFYVDPYVFVIPEIHKITSIQNTPKLCAFCKILLSFSGIETLSGKQT